MKKSKTTPEGQVRITPVRRVTMTDVAKMAGCSQSTVSIVLNNTPGFAIARDTRERVAKAAKSLGYILQKSAQSNGRSSRQIAIIFDFIATSPEAVEAIEGAREAAWRSAHVVSSFQTMNDNKMEELTLETAISNGVDLLIYATIMTREVTVPKLLYDLDRPVVLLNCYSSDRRFQSVIPGEVAGGHLATRTLISAGHQRIAHITGETWMEAAQNRLAGYRQALSSADILFDADLVVNGDWQTSSGYQCTLELLRLDKPPTAIFCSNDRMAVGAYEAIKELGLKIPQDISVIGYDDQEIARHLSPPLTTLVLPHREMGRWAVETGLEKDIPNPQRQQFPLVKLECTLVKRSSVQRPRKTI
ncbi:MAG: LacI family DNA-binding transcriptional regulator [Paracoccaceae bacterium]